MAFLEGGSNRLREFDQDRSRRSSACDVSFFCSVLNFKLQNVFLNRSSKHFPLKNLQISIFVANFSHNLFSFLSHNFIFQGIKIKGDTFSVSDRKLLKNKACRQNIPTLFPKVALTLQKIPTLFPEVATTLPNIPTTRLKVATILPKVATNLHTVATNRQRIATTFPEVATDRKRIAIMVAMIKCLVAMISKQVAMTKHCVADTKNKVAKARNVVAMSKTKEAKSSIAVAQAGLHQNIKKMLVAIFRIEKKMVGLSG